MQTLFFIPDKLSASTNFVLLIVSLVLLVIICFRLIKSNDLFESTIIMSLFSLIIGICHLFMDAPDVAMTEVALGSCLATCVLLNLVKIFGNDLGNKVSKFRFFAVFCLCATFVLILIPVGMDLPIYGDPDTPVQLFLTKYYVENIATDIGLPSMVAAILGSYRGYDTLGEATVILVAGLAVVLILAKRRE